MRCIIIIMLQWNPILPLNSINGKSEKIPLKEFYIGEVPVKSSLMVKLVFAFILAIIAFMHVLLVMGVFDLKNVVYYFSDKVFDFYGFAVLQR